MPRTDPFDQQRTRARRQRLRDLLASEHDGAPLVVTDPLNVRYLSGFDGSSGALVVTMDGAMLHTDSRYVTQAADEAAGIEVRQSRDPLTGALEETGGALLLEGHHLSAARWEGLGRRDARLRLAPDLVARLRAVKDDAETACLRRACALSAAALQQVLSGGVLGRSERDVARELEWLLADGEGEGPGFPSIVAAGPNSARPHHSPTDRPIGRGDLLKIDFGARVRGYHADLTRTFLVDATPEGWQAEIHGLVAAAVAAGCAAAVPGMEIAQVDGAARGVIEQAGHGEHFGHGLGHGVGLAIHERPLIGPRADGTLGRGMVITIEPGVYLPGRGGVRIEETAEVGPQGCQPLVDVARDLLVVR